MAQMVKTAKQETQVRSLGKGMTIPSSILAWRTPCTEDPGRPSPWGLKESDTTEELTFSVHCH